MRKLSQGLINAKKDKHYKLSQRFLKLLKSGAFKSLSYRKQHEIVERVKRLERQLKDCNRWGNSIALNLKHWAVALALGVVTYTASAQEQPKKPDSSKNPFGVERERDREALRNNYLRYGSTTERSKMAFGFDLATTLGTPAIDNAVTGDFDGDGDVDAIYRPEGMATSYTLQNEGNFTFQPLEIELPMILNNPFAGDFDGDSDLDILVDIGSYGYDSIAVMLNDGTGNFNETGAAFAINTDLYYSSISDFDGDGDLDILSNTWSGYLSVGLGDGAGNFTAGQNIPSVEMLLGTGDFDNDGDTDLLVNEVYQYDSGYGVWDKTRFTIFRNDGNGNFTSDGVAIFNPDFYQSRVFVQDINGDGFVDLLSPSQIWDSETQTYSKSLEVFINNGQGSFPATPNFATPLEKYFYEVQFVDLDGDTDIDILSSTYENFGSYALINDGNGVFTEIILPVTAGARAIDDFDNDGDIDLLSFSAFNADSWRNEGDLQFSLVERDIIELATSASLDFLDLNGDGAAEVLQFGASKVWQNSGDSRNFTVSQRFNSFDIDHKLVDIDDDGDMDVVTAVYSQMNHVGNVLRNDNGTFVVSDSLGFEGADEGYRIAVGDIDMDGDSDIAILAQMYSSDYYMDTQKLIFFSNNGSGGFAYSTSHDVPSGTEYEDFDLVDIDGDGDIDIIGIAYTSAYENSGLVIGRNDGAGGFIFEDRITPTYSSSQFEEMAIADFDGDSDLDIFLLDNGGGYSHLFVNDGSGAFTFNEVNISIADEGRVVAGDMDNDGDADLVLAIGAEYEDSSISIKRIFLNDGAGNFTDSDITMQSVGYYTYALNVGDVDGDSDLDILVGGISSPVEIWINSLNTVSPLALDRQALVSLYNSLGGPEWTDGTNWNTEEDVSTWHGVTVSNDRITSLNLSDNNLTGHVTDALLNLSALQNLDLSGNNITGIPDLSSIGTLTSADISENSLDFGDLEPNADVPFLVYSPQSAFGVHEVINSPVNSSVTLSENAGGTGNTYQWYFEDQLLEGEVSAQLTITDLTAATMGEYKVEVSNTMLPNLTLTSVPDQVNATATLAGLLADTESNVVNTAEVTLLRVTSSNGFDTVATVNPNIDGFYSFTDVVLAHYQVIGDPDLEVNPNLLPTYYPSSIFWEEADTINLTTNIANVDIDINIFVEESLGGTGEISGELFEEVPDGGRLLAKKRIAKAGVSIRRGRNSGRSADANSKMLAEYDLIAHLKTDENGQFLFTDLTDGVYRLNIQYPGYPMDENSFIDINIGTTGGRINEDNNKVQVEAEVTGGEIVVRNVTVLSVDDDKVMSDIHLFPNPSKGLIHIKMNKMIGDVNASLYDNNGKLVYQKQIIETTDQQIDLTTIPNGTYILKLNTSDNLPARTFKIILE